MLEKYRWIANESGLDADDVMDIVLGNITKPKDDVSQVLNLAIEYDLLKEKGSLKTRLDS